MKTSLRFAGFVLAASSLAGLLPRVGGQTVGTVTTVHSFTGVQDGSLLYGAVVEGSDGNFYGTTASGNADTRGTIFRVTPTGTATTLYEFTIMGSDGKIPHAGMVQGDDGNFYGTTTDGGNGPRGTIFRITPAGAYAPFYNFAYGDDGNDPEAALIKGRDGNFYGTTRFGGAHGGGVVFRVTPAGLYATLHSFTRDATDGTEPLASLVEGRDGNFYGTTKGDENFNIYGTVFRITPAGVLTTLHVFTNDGTDGAYPVAGVVEGGDGNFYGTTRAGGAYFGGTVFRMTAAGKVTTLHSFTNGADGSTPKAALVEGSDGNLYGTTYQGSSANRGTVYRITRAGVLTTLYGFGDNGTDGAGSSAALIAGRDGDFYGTTEEGGSHGGGTVFRLSVKPVVTSATGAAGTVGKAFSYRIKATNAPSRFGVLGLPAGLKVDAMTGVISGTPTAGGTKKLTLKATNAFGTGTATLTLTILGPPVVTSEGSVDAERGTAFTYKITATNRPASYGVQSLPKWLTLNVSTGELTGTPPALGTYHMTVQATNSAGTGSRTVAINVTAP